MALRYVVDGNTVSRVEDMRYSSGSARNANPERPTISHGYGSLRMHNTRVAGRKTFEVYNGSNKIIDAWLQEEQYNERNEESRYILEGKRFQAGRSFIELSQTAVSADASSASIVNLLRDAYRVSSVESSLDSTPLSVYSYRGPAAGYASRFAAVAGGLPYEDTLGNIGIKSPHIVPAEPAVVLSEYQYRIARIESFLDIRQLWNEAAVSYNPIDDSNAARDSLEFTFNAANSRTTQLQFNLPNISGVTYSNVRISPSVSSVSWVDMNGTTRTADGFSAPITISNLQVSGRRVTADATIADGIRGYSEIRRGSTFSIETFLNWVGSSRGNRQVASSAAATFYLRYRITRPERTIEVSNKESVRVYGPRRLMFDPWFAHDADDEVRERLDNIAEPRNINRVALWLDQRNATKTGAVAMLQPGDFVAVPFLGTMQYIMNVEYHTGSTISDMKVLTCFDTGVKYSPAGGDERALSWRSEELTWRTNSLTWR